MPSSAEIALVVGAEGFIGRHLVRILRAQGRAVATIGRSDGDLTDWPTAERLFSAAPKVDEIFHVATRQRTGEIQYRMQGELLAINTRMHLNVLEAWRQHQPQAKLVSTGSSCVYPELDYPIPESALHTGPLHPSVQGYGLAKLALIEGSDTYATQYGLSYLHCIFATVYGPGAHKEQHRSHFMAGMIDRAVREKRAAATALTVWGSPNTIRDLLHVDDQIDAMLAADAAFRNCIVNCSSNAPVNIGEVASVIARALEWDVPTVYQAGSFRGTQFKSIDSTRFLTATGWRPKIDLLVGTADILRKEYGI